MALNRLWSVCLLAAGDTRQIDKAAALPVLLREWSVFTNGKPLYLPIRQDGQVLWDYRLVQADICQIQVDLQESYHVMENFH